MSVGPEHLRRLSRYGFRGERIFGEDNRLNVVHYSREADDGRREVLLLFPDESVFAYATRDLLDPDDPLTDYGDAIEWRKQGDLVVVTQALLTRPRENAQPPPPGKWRHGPTPPFWTPPPAGRS